MKERTLYEVLMLHPTATIEVINAVYRALAKQHHPDYAGPEGAEKMAQHQRGLRHPLECREACPL